MQQQLDLQPFDAEKLLLAVDLRKQIASTHTLDPDSVLSAMVHMERLEKGYFQKLEKDTALLKTVLNGIAQYEKKQTGEKVSKITVCLLYIKTFAVMPLLQAALSFYDQDEIPSFITFYDYISGIMHIIYRMQAAISYLEDKGEGLKKQESVAFLQEKGALPQQVTDEVFTHYLKEHEISADLFKEDSTGFLLIKNTIAEIEKEIVEDGQVAYKRIEEYQYPGLVFYGAQFGQKIYQTLYNLWKDS